MSRFSPILRAGCAWCALALLAPAASAECARVDYTRAQVPTALNYVDPAYGRTGRWGGAVTGLGGTGLPAVINLDDGTLQPVGTLLGMGTSTLAALYRPALDPEQVLFRCTPDEAGKLYEYFATNAQGNDSGAVEAGAKAGLPGAYATGVDGVLLRITHTVSGQYFRAQWQRRALAGDKDGAGYLLIKARHFSAVQVEALRGPSGNGWTGPGPWPLMLPNGFIAFQGGGISAGLRVGDTSGANRSGWYTSWPGGINPYGQVMIRRAATCTVSTQARPLVFATISTARLAAGDTRSVTVAVRLDCQSHLSSDPAVNLFASGVGPGQTALGFLPAAVLAVPGVDTTQYLLSDGYGSAADIATGVGIRLLDAKGRPLQLLSADAPGGAGWYPVLDDATALYLSSTMSTYRRTFTATLQALPGQQPRPGKVRTRAYVLVKVQ